MSKWALLGPTRKNAFQWKPNLRKAAVGLPAPPPRLTKNGRPQGAARICAPMSRGEKCRR